MNKIVRIIGLNSGGGCRIHAHQLNTILEDAGRDTVTFIPKPKFRDRYTDEKRTKTKYINTKNPLIIAYFLLKNRNKIIYAHLHLKNAVCIYGPLLKFFGINYYVTIHQSIVIESARQFMTTYWYRKQLKSASKIVSISHFIESQMQQMGLKTIVIYNASEHPNSTINGIMNKKEKKGSIVVGVVGELTKRKGIEDFPRLALMCPEVEFRAYGEGPLASEITGLKNVTLCGYRTDMDSVYQELDIMLALSHNEPFGRVITEAFAAGLPVVARGSGAFPELAHPDCLFHDVNQFPSIIAKLRADTVRAEVIEWQNAMYIKYYSLNVFREKVLGELA